ncbi:hypothetical protein [Cryptosporangium aurantiacum]|uniref:Uncharacterized protein n=1 Tax=Cryptosporangium aurantiacum TaxID=134849 RepID=A0A1M7P9L9_9ACTN|nr:hypothetical protein [Cryptosporangium aurantiacum]SHN13407.1 hypothetical protein SAMN05443668_10393 [Cryptosporangium aurantiacum]
MSTTTPPTDPTLAQILEALQSIAEAVNRGTDAVAGGTDAGQASQEQSTAIVDYLVLRELVGRQADEIRRTVAATRFAGGTVVFEGGIPATAVKVAVFTRRSAAPDEVADITIDDGSVVDVVKKHRGARRRGSGPVIGFALASVTDDQPVARVELRDAGDLAVALGPRLAPVS